MEGIELYCSPAAGGYGEGIKGQPAAGGNPPGPADGGDQTPHGNQGSVNNPPGGGASHDQDRAKPEGVPAAQPGATETPAGAAASAPPYPAGPGTPQAPGGPAGAEHNPDPPRPVQEDGFSPPDTKRGWKG
jgi:hypothetical protein